MRGYVFKSSTTSMLKAWATCSSGIVVWITHHVEETHAHAYLHVVYVPSVKSTKRVLSMTHMQIGRKFGAASDWSQPCRSRPQQQLREQDDEMWSVATSVTVGPWIADEPARAIHFPLHTATTSCSLHASSTRQSPSSRNWVKDWASSSNGTPIDQAGLSCGSVETPIARVRPAKQACTNEPVYIMLLYPKLLDGRGPPCSLYVDCMHKTQYCEERLCKKAPRKTPDALNVPLRCALAYVQCICKMNGADRVRSRRIQASE